MLKFFRTSLVSKSIAALIFTASLASSPPTFAEETEQKYLLNEAGELTTEDEQVKDGSYLDVYEIETQPNQDLVILLGSDDFDSYLIIFDEEWNNIAANDDFQGTHSGLILENPDGGLYRIVATGASVKALGTYFLTVRETTASESTNVQANNVFAAAQELYNEGSADSLREARERWLTALGLYREVENFLGQGNTLNKLGFVADRLGEKELALSQYTEALEIYQSLGDRRSEALVMNNIGHVFSTTGDKQTALEYYTKSLNVLREIGDRQSLGSALNNLGAVHGALGNLKEALRYYEESLPILQEVENQRGEALTLSNIGSIYDIFGEKQQALDYYEQALPILQEIGDRGGEATALNNIGVVYDDLGEQDIALNYYKQSLPLSEIVGDRLGEARTLSNIGLIYNDKGDRIQALAYHQKALPILRDIGDRVGEGSTLNNIGHIFSQVDDENTALEYYEKSLQLSRDTGDRAGEATTLNNIGLVFEKKDDVTAALDYYRQSLTLSESVGDRAGSALTLFNIASLAAQQGNTEIALTAIEQSLDIVEDLRTKVASPELRQSYFSTVQDYYNLRIRLLMQLHEQDSSQNYDGQAFSVSEQSRARTLIDLLTEANTDIRTGISPELLATEQEFLQTLDDIEQARLVIYNNPQSTTDDQTKVDQRLAIANENYRDLQNQIRRESPQYANLKYPEPLTVEELQAQVLDEDTVLLQYAVGSKQSYLWAITKNSLSSYVLPNEKILNKAVNEVRGHITSVKTGLPEPIQRREDQNRLNAINQLSELILAPAAEQLDKKRLIIVADGNLHFLPFSALSLSGLEYNPIGDRHEIVNLPSASTISILRENTIEPIPQNASLAILADPVFHDQDCRIESDDPACLDPQPEQKLDPRPDEDLSFLALKRSAKGFNDVNWDRLLGTRTEAQSIVDLMPNTDKTLQAFDFNANRELMTGDRLQDYDLIHIATHGFLNTESPELSGLVLSLIDKKENPQNGFLRINDVFNLKLNADLIVLSACQTGLGDQVHGEGLVGLSRGFMYAGVPRIVVSLWQVDDAATAEFMTRFYRLLLRENLTPAAALKQTQQEMRTETEWTHPYYWAAFILQGEWR